VTVNDPDAHFPGYDVTAQARHWDQVTAGVVLARLGPRPPVRFFTIEEEAVARPLLDRLLALDRGPRVPVFEFVDARLAENETDGWHYDDLPPDGEAWRRSLHFLDDDARSAFGVPFADLDPGPQKTVLERVHVASQWHGWCAAHVWSLWLRYACAAFYAHPFAWDEIGFPGPAYPRGYANLHLGGHEHWETRERDAHNPRPWAERVEAARARHARGLERP
jgi:hypothetical protein